MDKLELLPVLTIVGQHDYVVAPQQPAVLPHQLSERSFRRYESLIAELVTNYPSSTTATAQTISPITMVARLRDAMSSLLTNNWTTYIDVQKLLKIRSLMRVAVTSTGLVVGPRKTIHLPAVATNVIVTTLPPGCLDAIVLLLHHRIIPTVNIILTTDQLTNITSNYDISYEHQTNGTVNLF